MVISFGLTDDREAVGYYAGFVLSAFMLGRLVSSYPLGVLSDSFGRRPVIELGLWSCVVFQLGFGLAPSFEAALLMRFLMGMCNGIIGVSKAWLPDLVPPERQPMAMSLVSGMWGIGQVAGPALGGLLVAPPTAASGSDSDADSGLALLLQRFPYLLPNLVGAVLAALSLVAVRRYLPDDRTTAVTAADSTADNSVEGESNAGSTAKGRHEGRHGGDLRRQLVPAGAARSNDAAAAEDAPPPDACSGAADTSGGVGGVGGVGCGGCGGLGLRQVPAASLPALSVYCLLSFYAIMYNEAYPLWCVAPPQAGGLGWDARHIGALMSFGGGALPPLQPCTPPPLTSPRPNGHPSARGPFRQARSRCATSSSSRASPSGDPSRRSLSRARRCSVSSTRRRPCCRSWGPRRCCRRCCCTMPRRRASPRRASPRSSSSLMTRARSLPAAASTV